MKIVLSDMQDIIHTTLNFSRTGYLRCQDKYVDQLASHEEKCGGKRNANVTDGNKVI